MKARTGTFAVLLAVAALLPGMAFAQTSADGLIAWTYWYHDGTEGSFFLAYYTSGELVETPGIDFGVPSQPSEGSDAATQWSLSRDGRYLAFASPCEDGLERVNRRDCPQSDVRLYDRVGQVMVQLPFNTAGFEESAPSLSSTGRYLAYFTKQSGAGNIKLFDRATNSTVLLPGLNTNPFVDMHPSISGNGRFIAFSSDRNGSLDVFLYDRKLSRLVALPGLNRSDLGDYRPSISNDGNLIAFVADKPPSKGEGSSYIRLYNRANRSFIPLPGIHDVIHDPNSDESCAALVDCWHDDEPSLNAAGTLVAFSSNRCTPGEGIFDHPCLYLYDRATKTVTELPFADSNYEPAIR